MLINTFLETYDFRGKTIVPFATSGGSGMGKSVRDIRNAAPAARVLDGLLVRNTESVAPLAAPSGADPIARSPRCITLSRDTKKLPDRPGSFFVPIPIVYSSLPASPAYFR